MANCKSKTFENKKALRIKIAKDVLAQLGGMNIRRGAYVEGDVPYVSNIVERAETISKRCDVCALGACFVTYAKMEPKLTAPLLRGYQYGYPEDRFRFLNLDYGDVTKPLKKIFCSDQLSMIESAFETSDFYRIGNSMNFHSGHQPPEFILTAIEFGKKYKEDKVRLRAIMQNIVDNDGTFCPNLSAAKDFLERKTKMYKALKYKPEQKIESLRAVLRRQELIK